MLPEAQWYHARVTFTSVVGNAADDLTQEQCNVYLAHPGMHPGAYAEEIILE